MTLIKERFHPENFSNYRTAAQNYLKGLNIPPEVKPNFLIITDRSPNLLGRQVLANNLALLTGEIFPESNRHYLSFKNDEEPEKVQKNIKEILDHSKDMVVVLLSGQHNWRFGVYDSVEKDNQLQPNVIRFAYSPGLTASDAFILEQMDETMQKNIISEVEKRSSWFNERGSGELTVKTGINQDHSLTLFFNMDNAPVISSSGFLSDSNQKGNVPSGEAHLVPYPFNKSKGEIETTSGLIIKVENGLATYIDTTNSHGLTSAEKLLIDLVNLRRVDEEGIPLSELGLGVLEKLGIKTKVDDSSPDGQMSILTLEKLRLHMGFGVIAGKSTEKEEIKSKLKRGQSHTDVLLSNPAIIFQNEAVDFN